MKIISKYVLREHLGPLTFALTALTSLMLLNYIAKQFGDLVGKGLPTKVIVKFFLLAIPFTVAMTLPMAVLVAVLYAFSRLASENEITAFKASGVSMWRLMIPALVAGAVLALVMLAFNDQILPRSNYALANLQRDIIRTKPTFALKEQVINPLQEGRLYLRAGHIDRASGQMREVVVYDMTNPVQRRTIYADSGTINMAENHRDVYMTLYDGVMQTVPSDHPAQLTRLFYKRDRIRVAGVAGQYQESDADVGKGDREMSICEMQRALIGWQQRMAEARRDSFTIVNDSLHAAGRPTVPAPVKRPAGSVIGALYCDALAKVFQVKEAQAAEVVPAAPQEPQRIQLPARRPAGAAINVQRHLTPTERQAAVKAQQDSVMKARADSAAARAKSGVSTAPPATINDVLGTTAARLMDVKSRMQEARLGMNRYEVEIQKKFSLAASCLIFVLLGAPLALRFPRGGVGMVLGVSMVIFAIYYVGLIGGESLANNGLVSPFWAMWGANVVMIIVGIVLAARMGYETNTGRGGGFAEWWAGVKERWLGRRRPTPEAGSSMALEQGEL